MSLHVSKEGLTQGLVCRSCSINGLSLLFPLPFFGTAEDRTKMGKNKQKQKIPKVQESSFQITRHLKCQWLGGELPITVRMQELMLQHDCRDVKGAGGVRRLPEASHAHLPPSPAPRGCRSGPPGAPRGLD